MFRMVTDTPNLASGLAYLDLATPHLHIGRVGEAALCGLSGPTVTWLVASVADPARVCRVCAGVAQRIAELAAQPAETMIVFDRVFPPGASLTVHQRVALLPRSNWDYRLLPRRSRETAYRLGWFIDEALLNALSYSDAPSRLVISLAGVRSNVLVADEGPGIRAQLAAHGQPAPNDSAAILAASVRGFSTSGGGAGLTSMRECARRLAPSRLRISSGTQAVQWRYASAETPTIIELERPIPGTVVELETAQR
jgi:hypothetical protein